MKLLEKNIFFKSFKKSLSEEQLRDFGEMSTYNQLEWYISYLENHFSFKADSSKELQDLKPKYIAFMKIFSDVEHHVYLIDEDEFESEKIRRFMNYELPKLGFRNIKENETVKQYWENFRDEYQDKIFDAGDVEIEGCDTSKFDIEDDHMKFADTTVTL